MRTSDFDYELPSDRIAQRPASPRDSSRLLILNRAANTIEHRRFTDLKEYLRPGDALVINETLVIPARLKGQKIPGGAGVELLLLKQITPRRWEVIVGGKGLVPGREVQINGGPLARIEQDLGGSKRLVTFSQAISPFLESIGEMPLPPYIKRPIEDNAEYQTIFAKRPGSAAAPTAGLHFRPETLNELRKHGVAILPITLHVGLDTFAPVTETDPSQHLIHTEWCSLNEDVARQIIKIKEEGGRIVAVGTTSVRTLESAARVNSKQIVTPFEGATDLFILPGFEFQLVDAMITNFHLPRSSLIMLVSAFAGRERILNVYAQAIKLGYRFYSFGDAMLIL